jgi:hypothetical protein
VAAKWDTDSVKAELTAATLAARLQERMGHGVRHRGFFSATKPLEWVAFLPVDDARALLTWLTWVAAEGHEDYQTRVVPKRHQNSLQTIAEALNGKGSAR